MKNTMTRRVLSLLLSIALLFSQTGLTALAADVEAYTPGSLCEHHSSHTVECGYSKGAPCAHEHTASCYTDELICSLAESGNEIAATSGAPHTHTQECYEMDCPHADGQHDDTCSYELATPSCTYDCEICNFKDSGDVSLGVSGITITGFDTLAGEVQQQAVPVGTALESLDLPDELAAKGYTVADDTEIVDSGIPSEATPEAAPLMIENVKWELDPANEINDGNDTYSTEGGSYCFTPILHENYTLAEGMSLPEIRVTVGGATVLTEAAVHNISTGDLILTDESDSGGCPGHTVTGTTTQYKIVVESGEHDITLDSADIQLSADNACAFELQDTATVNLTLSGKNTLKSGSNKAGLQVQSKDSKTATLIITESSTGSLTANGGTNGAGIGGGNGGGGGNITINGGSIIAKSSTFSAGIGGGGNGGGGTVTVNGGSVTAIGGGNAAGIGGSGTDGHSDGVSFIMNGGTVTATGGPNGAGIGGGPTNPSGGGGSGGIITINGGTVTANGCDDAAGIGGGGNTNGWRSGGGSITISGGTVTAASIGNGTGHWGDPGCTFSTTANGNAFIVADSIRSKSAATSWSGAIIVDNSGKVYGSPTLGIDATIPAGKTLTIDSDKTLTIGSGVTLTNNGTIVNNGTITNNGTILNYGTITGNTPEGGTLIKSSKVEVSFAKSGGATLDAPNTAAYGDTIQITATVGEKVNTKSLRSRLPAVDTVDFYLGGVADGNKLSENPVSVSNGTATLNITLTGENWKAGSKTIIADFGGTTNSLLDSQGSAQLTVTKAAQNATSVAVSSAAITYGGAAPTITAVTVSDNAVVTYSAVTEANGSTPSDVASINDTTITINKAGAFYVKAAIAETADYADKTIYSAKITVNPAAQATVPAPALTNKTATGITLTHTAPGGSGTGALKYGCATEDSATNINSWQTALIFTGLHPNTQYYFFAKREADDNYKEAISTSLSVTTNKGTQTVTTDIGYGKASFTYGDAAQALVTTPVFSQSGTITYASSDSSVISIDETSGKITFNKVGTATITATNAVTNYENKTSAVEITVNNADQAAPSVTAVAETFAGENDGKITGTTTAMEYSTTTDFASATDCTGTEITSLAPGTYYVRYKAKDNYNAGAHTEVTIKAGPARTYTLTVSAPTFTAATYGYSQPASQNITITSTGNSNAAISSVTVSGTAFEIGGSGSTVTAGGKIATWTVQPKAGLNAGTYTETITVAYNNSATATASVSFTVNRATPSAPSAPTQPSQEDKTTHNSITINTASGQKYICTTGNSAPAINGGAGWTDGTGSTHTFTGLARDTNYYIWAYTVETTNYNNSAVSTALEVKTENEPVASVNVLGITAPVAKAGPDTSAENGTGWTAGNVSWYTDTSTSFTGDSFDYEIVYTAKVTLTAAEGYQFPDTVTAQVGGNGATVSDKGTSSITVSYTYPATNERGQTAVPSFADASYAMQTAKATAAAFALTSDTMDTNYKLFNQLTGGGEVSSGVSMNVSSSTLTLIFTAAPTQDTTYYVSATKGDDKESIRATITVKAYVATTGISLNKNELALNVGGSETLLAAVTPDTATNKTATWTSSDSNIAAVDANGKVTAIKTGIATIAAKAADGQTAICAVNVKASNGGGGDTGGSGGGSDTPSHTPPTVITPPATPEQPNPPTNGESKVDGTVDKDGNATVKVPDKAVTDAITAAKKQAGQNGISVTLNVTLKQTANSLTVTISKAALDRLIAEGVKELKFTSSLISFGFNLEALKEIQKSVTGDLTIAAKKLEAKTLSKDAQAAIGNRPVFDFAMQSGGKSISDFGKGRASVWMPYAPANNEAEGSLQAVYVDDKGGVEWIIGSSYNKDAKALLFSTDHFSIYGVGYQTVPVFTDTVNHWAKDDIEFVAARGLLSGTGATTFSPDTAMTRGMFVTALWRLAGIPQAGEGVAFTDVPSTAYYSNAVKWAAKNGIVSRTSATTFVPDKAITRQEMAVIMQNYTKALGYTIPQTRAAVIFADSSGIGSWAAEAVKAMQMAGIINGKDSNKFDPTGTATRAEVSAVLRRYVELVIDSSTAQGWMQNDSGQWMYYENGKPVTGKRDIGGTTYTFGHYGEIADMPKNLTYDSYIVKKSDSWRKIACEQNCNIYELARVNGKTIFSIIYEGDILKIPKKG